MRFNVTIDSENNLVRIAHFGEITLDDMLTARAKAGKSMRENGILLLLVDASQVEIPPTTLEIFDVASTHHVDLPKGTRLALAIPGDQQAEARFAENVSSNRGIQIRTFTDATIALDWLLNP